MQGFTQGLMGWADRVTLQPRKAETHKGSFGTLACVTGSQGMAGAGVMCVGAALRAGAGLVTAGVPACLQSVFEAQNPESTTFVLDDFSGSLSDNCIDGLDKLMVNKVALAAGPGLGTGSGAMAAVRHLLTQGVIRKVFDADALNLIAKDIKLLENKKGDVVLTPHPLEFSRLCGVSVEQIKSDPLKFAQEFALKYHVELLLKGTTTIVTDGQRTMFVTAGSPGMARGGSGDILTGVIGSLMCGGREGGKTAFEAAVTGAYICGKAGEVAAKELGELSMTAMDTLAHIPCVTKEMMKKHS
jgi:NAD(P)H-hydrate epimerase